MIKTKSFEIATYEKGDPNSQKLVLLLPGKLDSKDYPHMRGHIDFLANLEFYAVTFDPPGTWESPGDISLYNITNYLKAIDELIEHFANKPTLLVGHSRGGSMAMLAGMRNSNVKAFVSIMSYVYNKAYNDNNSEKTKEWKEKGYWESSRDLPPGGGEKTKVFRLPYSFYLDQIKYDLTDELSKCTKPKLFVAGKQDEIVNPQLVRQEFEKAPEPKEFYELDTKHDYRFYPDKIEELNSVFQKFLTKHWK
jgi:pimeloyl-ACP methyl ester carboxylesterase